MPEGLSTYLANELLDAVGNNGSFAVTAVHIQLHVGAPGGSGTSNVATETDRVSASFSAASGGALTNDAAIQWVSVAGAEDYTHWTAWDASTSGNFLFSGTMTANAVLIGDTFTIPTGDMDISFTVAS